MLKLKLFLLLIFSIFLVISNASLQRYIVKGKLLCGTKPIGKVQLKLIDIDSPGYDDVMDEAFSDDDGHFKLDGQTEETTPIDPCLKIYHDCSDGFPCQRRWKMFLPKKYIVAQSDANPENKTVDIGVFNLESHWHEEKRKCITLKKV